MKTDSLFFRLFEEKPEWFFSLLGESTSTAAQYQLSSIEWKDTSQRVDGVFLAKNTRLPVYFLEVQFYRQPEIFASLLAKVFRYLKQHGPAQVWRGVVLFGSRNLEPADLTPYKPLLDTNYVVRIYLDELPERSDAPLGQRVLQLISLSEAKAPRQARLLMEQAAREISDVPLRRRVLELIETVVLYKLPRLSRKEIQAMLQVDDIRETRIYQEALAEGKAEGKAEGVRSAKLALIGKLLTKKMAASEIAELLDLDIRLVKREIKKLQS